MSNKIELRLPEPHPGQVKVIQQARRFNVVCCGRRWGKTALGMDRLIQTALQGKPVAWFSPSNKYGAETWRELRATLAPVTRDKSEQEKRLELVGGGVVDLWSLDSPDSGRGRKYAMVVIDEAALVANLSEAWQQSIRPTLTDLLGSAWFLSTPRGMDYFKVLFDRGQDPAKEDWASWQKSTSDNPFIPAEEIEAAQLELPELAFSQEFLAQFVNWEGSVFRRVIEAATINDRRSPEAGHEYVIGCDWGRSNDYTVFLVLDTTARAVVAMDRSNRVDYAIQCDRLKVLNERWKPKLIIAEQNSIGQPVIEQLQREHLPVQPFNTTNASKAEAIQALSLAFERGDIRILNDPILVSELGAYQAEVLSSGQIRYSAPNGQHDDTVMALAMAWTAVSKPHRLIYPIPDQEIVIPDRSIPDHWPRAYALDIRWNTVAVISGARDPESDVIYLDAEYYADAEPSMHAAAVGSRNKRIPGFMDPTANGRTKADGDRLMQQYRKHGLMLQGIDSPLESGILEVSQRMSTGRLKVFASLSRFLEERRSCRCDERNLVVRERDNLQDAVRCLVLALSRMRSNKSRRMYYPDFNYYSRLGDRAWMA
jgi:hypothetical protein